MLTRVPNRNKRLASCLSVTVPEQGEARLTFALPAGTTLIKGQLHLLPIGNSQQRQAPRWDGEITASAVFGAQSVAIQRIFQIAPPQEADVVRFDFQSQRTARVCLEAVAFK